MAKKKEVAKTGSNSLSEQLPDVKQRNYVLERLERNKDITTLILLDNLVIVKSLEHTSSGDRSR